MHLLPAVPHLRRLGALCLLGALLSPLSAQPPAKPRPGPANPQAKALLEQAEQERALLLEARRQALILAARAATPEERLRIFRDLRAAQRDRLARLREQTAQAHAAEKQPESLPPPAPQS
ncbi:MAG: hypothetical protein PHE83_09250 [Opitutaceae bacterium]|nr:hypothetical protein [Opitutaceae bacterium]